MYGRTELIGASGADVVSDFETDEDILDISGAGTGFTGLSDLVSATTETSMNGSDGVLIELSADNVLFIKGLSLAELQTLYDGGNVLI
ncbi:hypothetical protein [Kordiimonas pumila]|uniref:Uncharacterized protein n=1 Tax=Kordiimonas pumila TaxID=2161677 RepID=A0ABV7D4A6_9PROT|nr:hypothetical protein [Kordiimonas pumila]